MEFRRVLFRSAPYIAPSLDRRVERWFQQSGAGRQIVGIQPGAFDRSTQERSGHSRNAIGGDTVRHLLRYQQFLVGGRRQWLCGGSKARAHMTEIGTQNLRRQNGSSVTEI